MTTKPPKTPGRKAETTEDEQPASPQSGAGAELADEENAKKQGTQPRPTTGPAVISNPDEVD